MPFGEYELSPGLIGLSLLHSAHPEAFQRLSVRASIPRYRDFTLAKCRSPGFASATADYTPCSGSLSLRLPASSRLTSPATATRRLIMQKGTPSRAKCALRPLAGAWFQGLFHSPCAGCFPTFPSRYLSTIGLKGVFSLAGWSRRIHAGFLVPRATQGTAARRPRSRKGLSPAAARLSRRFRSARACALCGPTTPLGRCHPGGLGSSPVARHYWGNHCCFLFLRVLRCFSSPRWPRRICGGPAPAGRGLSHSDTCGSKAGCASPQIFAASRVLHRLLEPRHPPCALIHFLPLREKPGRDSRRLLLGSRRSNFLFLLAVLSQNVKERMPKTKGNVENNGFEPLTPCLQSRCSSQLS